MTDWLDIVEAAYHVQEPSHEQWLARVAEVTALKMGGLGSPFAGIFHFPRGGQLQMFSHPSVPVHTSESSARIAQESAELSRALLSGPPFSSLSTFAQQAKRHGAPVNKPVRELLGNIPGIEDALGLSARDPGPWGIVISAPVGRAQRVSAARASPWARVAAHVHAALRIRFRIHGEPAIPGADAAIALHAGIDAFLNDDGKVVHAEGDAIANRDRLREAARAIIHARGDTPRRDADDALTEWQALVDGKWTLVDHFDTDGRRFLVARRNPPGGEAHSALSVDEARAAGFRAMGHSLKLIGYELGFSIGTVSRLLGSAAKKLGLESSRELVHLGVGGIQSPSKKALEAN